MKPTEGISYLEKMFSTKSEAIEFLQNEWKMKDVAKQIQDDREKFLNKLIVTIHERVPFQLLFAVKISMTPPEQRKLPTLNEANQACITGNGGNCTLINLFTCQLLNFLGYDAFFCLATVTSYRRNPHLIAIVKDLINAGDIHVVDCGLGLPSFQAISLNFNEESPVYHDSFLEYKFIKHDGKVLRMHGDGDVVVHNSPPNEELDFIRGKWRRFYEFNFNTFNREIWGELRSTFFSKAVPKVNPRAAIFPGGKAVLLNDGNILSVEQDDKTLKKVILKSREEVFQAFKTYFPSIDEWLIQEAYETFTFPQTAKL